MKRSRARCLAGVILAGCFRLPNASAATNNFGRCPSCAFQGAVPRHMGHDKRVRSTFWKSHLIEPIATKRFRGSPQSSSSLFGGNLDNDDKTTIHNKNGSPMSLLISDPQRTLAFSALMVLCGALLGPFLDSFHSAFGVLQYDEPITAQLWGRDAQHPALITAWWVPELFGLAGFIIGWLYIGLDAVFQTPQNSSQPTPPKILLGISLFTFQYWLSGVLVAMGADVVDRTAILNSMSLYAAVNFLSLDGTMAGFLTSAATALGGPLIEVVLLSLSRTGMMSGGYHYNDLGETGFFPLWIIPVYFLGGPAVGNLARGFWNSLSPVETKQQSERPPPGCKVCNDTRRVGCPNCDGVGVYTAMGGKSVQCTSCRGRGYVICRACFDYYGEDPNDIEAVRELMSKMPD